MLPFVSAVSPGISADIIALSPPCWTSDGSNGVVVWRGVVAGVAQNRNRYRSKARVSSATIAVCGNWATVTRGGVRTSVVLRRRAAAAFAKSSSFYLHVSHDKGGTQSARAVKRNSKGKGVWLCVRHAYAYVCDWCACLESHALPLLPPVLCRFRYQ